MLRFWRLSIQVRRSRTATPKNTKKLRRPYGRFPPPELMREGLRRESERPSLSAPGPRSGDRASLREGPRVRPPQPLHPVEGRVGADDGPVPLQGGGGVD